MKREGLKREGNFETRAGESEIGNRKSVDGRHGYRNLQAWKSSDDLAVELLELASTWNRDLWWLKSQVLRAAISVPANIAEGFARGSNKEFYQFLRTANASLAEVEYFLHFLSRTGQIEKADAQRLGDIADRAGRTLYGLMKSARSDLANRDGPPRYLREEPPQYTPEGEYPDE